MIKYTLWILFLGAFFDALIGVNIFVHGEPFLIASGYALFGGNIYAVIVVYLGAFIGDQISYFIGRYQGEKGIEKLKQKAPKTRKGFVLLKRYLRKKGLIVIAGARLLGPVAWVMPFFAGANRIPYLRFTLYSLIGLTIGVGQFVFVGYLLAAGIQSNPYFIEIQVIFKEHLELIIFSFTGLVVHCGCLIKITKV